MITDPCFYVVAFFGVLINGIAKSGLGGGLGVITVPLMALVITPEQAAAVLLPILVVMDLFGIAYYRSKWDARNIVIMIPFAILGVILGFFAFGKLPEPAIRIIVGFIAIIFALNWFWPGKNQQKLEASVARGGFYGTITGFVSMLVHAGGPPASMYLLPQKMDKTIFVGTTVILFTVINLVKLVPYYYLDQLDAGNLTTSLILLPLAPFGIWLGVRLHSRINETWFYRICYTLLIVTGVKLLVDGVQQFFG